MHLAACVGNPKIARLLIENTLCEKNKEMNKLNLDVKDREGETPLFVAIYKHKGKMVEFLIEQGANLNCVNEKGQSVFEYTMIFGNAYIKNILKRQEN